MTRHGSYGVALLALVGQLACGGDPGDGGGAALAAETSRFAVPATRPGTGGFVEYVDAPTITAGAAGGLAPGTASPEAAVTHFYASRIRGDERWREVLVAKPSGRLDRTLAELDGWKFRSFRLVGRKDKSEAAAWVKVWFEIEAGGGVDSGTDEVGVVKVGNEWRIDSVPS